MTNSALAQMVDVAFALQGHALARLHGRDLANSLLGQLPWLADEPGAGIHRLNLCAGTGPEGLLPKRSRLVLRLPRGRVAAAHHLAGHRLTLGAHTLLVQAAPPQLRELLPHSSLYAHRVATACADELAFLAEITQGLQQQGVVGRLLCGRWQQAAGELPGGYSLMVDGLNPTHARRLLEQGVGAHRLWGCGLFVPHKSSAAVGS